MLYKSALAKRTLRKCLIEESEEYHHQCKMGTNMEEGDSDNQIDYKPESEYFM